MISKFITKNKTYNLLTDKYTCNKFGLSEFFSNKYDCGNDFYFKKILDVGCGVGPLGIYLSDQYNCDVVGIELNKIAFDCCHKNINLYNLSDKFELYNCDFSNFSYNRKFDFIISNPPVSINKSKSCFYNFDILNDESFSFLTNEWCSKDGKDLVDYIFNFAILNLSIDGKVIIIVCDILKCAILEDVLNRGCSKGFLLKNIIFNKIQPSKLGVENFVDSPIDAYILTFVKEG